VQKKKPKGQNSKAIDFKPIPNIYSAHIKFEVAMSWFNKLIVYGLPLTPKPVVKYFSAPYIAGPDILDAINTTRELNNDGMMATIDILGEEITHLDQADAAAKLYIEVLDAIEAHDLDANVSVKPTHMGLNLDADHAVNNIRGIVRHAKDKNNFVRIDMEDHTVTSQTIDAYRLLRKEFGEHVGTVIQAYMRRTIEDVKGLGAEKANLRLCKGIYNEPRRIAYKDYWTINNNFAWALDILLQSGSYVGIATHDERVVWDSLRLIEKYKLSPDQFEFQMLLGVDHTLRKIILDHGYRLRIYVPFGKDWYPYSVRRLKENPTIARHALMALFKKD
jgi:proline dehydrogenase